jgi:hypothetical protein
MPDTRAVDKVLAFHWCSVLQNGLFYGAEDLLPPGVLLL